MPGCSQQDRDELAAYEKLNAYRLCLSEADCIKVDSCKLTTSTNAGPQQTPERMDQNQDPSCQGATASCPAFLREGTCHQAFPFRSCERTRPYQLAMLASAQEVVWNDCRSASRDT